MTLELKLIKEFKGFQVWAKGDKRALYDIQKQKVFMVYTKGDNINKIINYWARIKNTNARR